jgi:hypothetical protein
MYLAIDFMSSTTHQTTKLSYSIYASLFLSQRATNSSGEWLQGLLEILFTSKTAASNSDHARTAHAAGNSNDDEDSDDDDDSDDVDIVNDPHEYANRSPLPEKEEVELMCFETLVLPGESRAVFRGAADARRFRFKV